MRSLLKSHRLKAIFAFNQYQRDLWVASAARSVKKGASVLDVGAGSAPYRQLFSHTDYKTHDFCQLKPHQLRGQKGYHVIDYVSDIAHIPVPDNTFDCILCTEVLEHVPEPIIAVGEMVRICKPGGILLISAPLGSGLHQVPYHYYGGYTPYWYKTILEKYGAEVKEITPNGGFFRLYAQETIRFVAKSKPWVINLPFVLKLAWAPLWVCSIFYSIALAILGRIMNGRECNPDFTVGYHVMAVKQNKCALAGPVH